MTRPGCDEAEKRGLLNLQAAPQTRCPHYVDQKNVDLFTKHNVYTAAEMQLPLWRSMLEEYNKILHIEALTMSDMVREEITPACIAFEGELAATVNSKKAAGVSRRHGGRPAEQGFPS